MANDNLMSIRSFEILYPALGNISKSGPRWAAHTRIGNKLIIIPNLIYRAVIQKISISFWLKECLRLCSIF